VQHLISKHREEDVAHEATTEDLLHRRTKSLDVGFDFHQDAREGFRFRIEELSTGAPRDGAFDFVAVETQ
jgi:hypothetical protein